MCAGVTLYLCSSSIYLSAVPLTVFKRGGDAARDSASASPHRGSSVPESKSQTEPQQGC